MPRTKISKSSKRNREVANREEKVREFETNLDEFLNKVETQGQDYIAQVEAELTMLVQRTSSSLLQMPVRDLLELNLEKFSDWKANSNILASFTNNSLSVSNATSASVLRSNKISNPNDEGYLTEDSSTTGHAGGGTAAALAAYTSLPHLRSQPQQQSYSQRARLPGPLSSARARRTRRSKSACGDFVPSSTCKPKLSTLVDNTPLKKHVSRSVARTPMARTKAFSADRTSKTSAAAASAQSPATAFIRWPKPGEMVLSQCGSPLVAQVMPDKYANVNIPVRDGVLSLRPKKLSELNPDIINAIDAETLNQIKTLHANLNLIVNMADKSAQALK